MNTVIAIPPLRDFYFTPHRFANLGIEVVNGILRDHGFKVTVFDFPASINRKTRLPLPSELAYLKAFIIPDEIGPLSFFLSYRHFGPSFADCAQHIKNAAPDIIFISCFAFAYAQETATLSAEIKRILPKITIIAGGAGVSAHPHFFLKNGSIDFSLTGEAEISLPRFLTYYRAGCRPQDLSSLTDICFSESSTVKTSKAHTFTTSSDLDFYCKKSLETKHNTYYSVCLSRGCSKRCRFCSLHLSHGRRFRTIPMDKVISGIKQAAEYINASEKTPRINFEDDNLLLAPDYFIKVLKTMRIYLPRAVFSAENGLDYTLLTTEILTALIQLGFTQFNLSLGSAHHINADTENRVLDLKHFERLVYEIRRHHLPCISYFICGLKNDTVYSTASTLAYLAKLPTRIGISLFYAVPGLAGFGDRSLFDSLPPTLCKGSAAYPWNNSLSTKTMLTAFRLSRFVNLLKTPAEDSHKQTETEKALVRLIQKEKKLYTLVKDRHGIRPFPVAEVDVALVSEFFNLLGDHQEQHA